MKSPRLASLLIVLALSSVPLAVVTVASQRRGGETGGGEQARPRQPQTPAEPERAKPRPPNAPPDRDAEPRRPAPPRVVVVPPGGSHFLFPPRSLDRGFYYHPRFLFYYGPYYGPLYQLPRGWNDRLAMSSVRLRVRPREAQVYVNGYYAGLVDEFDGILQRLYLPVGEHVLEFYLDGYRTERRPMYFGGGEAPDIVITMGPVPPGTASEPPSRPRPLPDRWTSGPPTTVDRPESPFGILAVTIDPADAELRIDEERWMGSTGRSELVVHMDAGWHQVEVRREGYRSFSADVKLTAGERTQLRVTLVPESGGAR